LSFLILKLEIQESE